MAYKLEYFPEHSLILIVVSDSVSLAENRAIGLDLMEQIDEAETTTDVLFDLRALQQFPTSIHQLRNTSAVIRDPRLGWIVLLTGDRPLLKFVATVLIKLQTHTGRIRLFDDLQNAIPFLESLHPIADGRAAWLSELRKTLS